MGLGSEKPEEISNYFLKTKSKTPYCDKTLIQGSSNGKKDYCKSGAVNFSYFYHTTNVSIAFIILNILNKFYF